MGTRKRKVLFCANEYISPYDLIAYVAFSCVVETYDVPHDDHNNYYPCLTCNGIPSYYSIFLCLPAYHYRPLPDVLMLEFGTTCRCQSIPSNPNLPLFLGRL